IPRAFASYLLVYFAKNIEREWLGNGKRNHSMDGQKMNRQGEYDVDRKLKAGGSIMEVKSMTRGLIGGEDVMWGRWTWYLGYQRNLGWKVISLAQSHRLAGNFFLCLNPSGSGLNLGWLLID
ncbi:hypothetical protein Ancab_007535, partial [Ancistrocladus abbreviatus]